MYICTRPGAQTGQGVTPQAFDRQAAAGSGLQATGYGLRAAAGCWRAVAAEHLTEETITVPIQKSWESAEGAGMAVCVATG
jgi:hypothetical protein